MRRPRISSLNLLVALAIIGQLAVSIGQLTPATFAAGAEMAYILTLTSDGPGAVLADRQADTYAPDSVVTLIARAGGGAVFVGWYVDGLDTGWANPLTLTMNANHAVVATFAPRPVFADVPANAPVAEAIVQLAARGVIKGYGFPDNRFGPDDVTLRAQMAALIARAMGWDGEDYGTPFGDRAGTDHDLWRKVGTLAHHGVARGYANGTFNPTDPVLHAQTISFITRAMVAKGYWAPQADNAALYPNVPAESGHRGDLATFAAYAGDVPGAAATAIWEEWDRPVTRAWFAITLWQALDHHFGTAVASATARNTSPPPVAARTPTATATATPVPATPRPSGTTYLFGTLISQDMTEAQAAAEYAAGVRFVELELGWNMYEPQDGVFDANYAAAMKRKLQMFQAAGFKVVLGVGLWWSPSWLLTYPNSTYLNQYGTAAPGAPNLTFNRTLRQRAEAYIARVDRDLGLNNFWAVRTGSGPYVETLLPEHTAGGNTNAYWAYDANAQGTLGNLPTSIPPTPFPGWRPGQTTYNGQPFTTVQVERWADWYLGAVADGANWQIAAYKRLGYTGYFHVTQPGVGTRPTEYNNAVTGYLSGPGDPLHTFSRGAVFFKTFPKFTDRQNVVINISSVYDGSSWANPTQSHCQATDAGVSLNDPQILAWSSPRWQSYLAKRYGMPTIGENPDQGYNFERYNALMMDEAAKLMQSCGLQGLYWAFDKNLHSGTPGVTLQDYATVISRYGR